MPFSLTLSGKRSRWERQRDALGNVLPGNIWGPGIHTDVTLTPTTYLNAIADRVHAFLAVVFPSASALFVAGPCHTAKIVQKGCEEHDKVFKVFTRPPHCPDITSNRIAINLLC